MKWIAGTLIALAVFIGWWLQDDPLLPEAQAWLETTPPQSDAYAMLLGLHVAEDQSPLEEGRKLTAEILANPDADIPLPDALPVQRNHSLLCSYEDLRCLYEQQTSNEARKVINENRLLLARYSQFLSLGEFSDNTPAEFIILPDYSSLVSASKLASLKWATSSNGTPHLQQEIAALRQLYAGNHSLISKMVFSAVLKEKIFLLSLLSQRKHEHVSITPLSGQEKSLLSAMKFELLFFSNQLDVMKSFGTENIYSTWQKMLSLGIKRNISVNQAFRIYHHYAQQSTLNSIHYHDFSYAMDERPVSERVRNLTGDVILGFTEPTFSPYIARVINLDARIRLLSWLPGNDGHYPNPWVETGQAEPNVEDNSLCFATPIEEDDYQVCIPYLKAS